MHRLRRRLVAALAVVGLVLGLSGLTALPAAARAACANLRVSAYSIAPVAPVSGQSVLVTVDVQNAGTCAAGTFVTQLQSVDTDPLSWQPRTTRSLAAGAVTTLVMGLDFPDAGSFVPTVVVDVNGAVAETDENDNRQVVPVTVRPATVDLVVTGVTLDPVRPVQGRPMTLTVGIRNLGTSTTSSFGVGWGPAWNVSGLFQRVDGLAGGASTNVTFAYTYASYWNFDSAVGVDGNGEVPEVDERNNYLSFQVPVDPPRPDLVVRGMHLSPSNPLPGEAVTAAFVVENTGNTGAGPFQLRWQPAARVQPLTAQAGGLAAGARRTLTLGYTFPTADVFQGVATVDPTGAVAEIEEADNTTVVTVPVAPHETNLKAWYAFVREATVRQGQPFHVDVVVTNTGDTASGPFDVAWNPDTKAVLGKSDRTLTQNVANLERGQRRTLTFTYTYWQEGAFASLATVDGDDRVVETVDKDNRKAVPVTVAEPDIDLEITGFTLSPAQPLQGSLTTATITVTNTGTVAAGPFVVQWKLPASSGANPRATVRGLPAAESRQITFGGTFADAGAATTSAVADVFHQVAEPGGEGNNVLLKDVTVKASG
jgi:subtilase family serine protease